jgi:hypothetical protein
MTRLERATRITGERRTDQLYPIRVFGSLFIYVNETEVASWHDVK